MRFLRTAWQWFDPRTDASKVIGPILRHPVPPRTGWMYVFGSATLAAFLIQVVTGIALATGYVSSAGQAYESLKWITNQACMGNLLRGMHYFGASAMLPLLGIHMIRTFLTGSYKFPRELNWIVGVLLLLLTLLMGFTGQLLRWAQNGVWSTIVAAEQAGRMPFIGHMIARLLMGGQTVGGATLSRFFAYHVFFIPALIFGMVGLHLALVLQHGISEKPDASRPVDPKTYRAWYEGMLKREGSSLLAGRRLARCSLRCFCRGVCRPPRLAFRTTGFVRSSRPDHYQGAIRVPTGICCGTSRCLRNCLMEPRRT